MGVCEVMPGIEERFPIIKEKKIPLYQKIEDFYKEHEADLAVISTPMHLHYSQAKYCMEHGSNVLLEKPVCTTLEDAEDLIQIQKRTGKFTAIGYQLNYERDVLALKQDILNGKYGKPVLMKGMQAFRRGEHYYHRNDWAERIVSAGKVVNDSPFNNASAHQFQVMTFLLGKTLETAADLRKVSGELYRANCHVENFDTAAVKAETEDGIPIYYDTTHNMKEKSIGPFAEYQFEKGVIYYGKDFGNGVVDEYTAVMNDGTMISYGDVPKGEQLQKLYDAIACTVNGKIPVCTVQCAIPHLRAVLELAKLSIHSIREEKLEYFVEKEDRYCQIRNLEEVYSKCYQNNQMPSEVGAGW